MDMDIETRFNNRILELNETKKTIDMLRKVFESIKDQKISAKLIKQSLRGKRNSVFVSSDLITFILADNHYSFYLFKTNIKNDWYFNICNHLNKKDPSAEIERMCQEKELFGEIFHLKRQMKLINNQINNLIGNLPIPTSALTSNTKEDWSDPSEFLNELLIEIDEEEEE